MPGAIRNSAKPSAKRPARPSPAGGFTKLVRAESTVKRAVGRRPYRRWLVRLVAVAAALTVLWLLFRTAVRILTTDMWFDSVHAGGVYTTMLEARVGLFCVFGGIAAAIGGFTARALHRLREPLPVSQDDDTFRWLFRRYEPRVWRLLVLLAAVAPGVLVGKQAAGGWQTYLMWRHAVPWHATDPTFHRDISFFVEVNPFHVMVVALLRQAVVYALGIAVVGGYWYGGWRLRRGRRKIVRGQTKLVSVLAAGYLVLAAANYWVARYSLPTSQRGPVTGPSYTDTSIALPSKYVLLAVALVGAGVLLANAWRTGRVRIVAAVAVATLAASALIGSAAPALLYHFREAPSAAQLDAGEIAHNQKATLAAFGLAGDVNTVAYDTGRAAPTGTVDQLVGKTAQVSLIDPNQLSPTFNVAQQLQAYYGFKSTLDVGNYPLGGRSQDVALAVRELRTGSIPQHSWVNTHLVYTHGYGVVAAPTTTVDPRTQSPAFLGDAQLHVTRPQVYFGQAFGPSSYAIVGQPAGHRHDLEFDHPAGAGTTTPAHTTYQAHGGIPIGSTLRRLLFAVQLHDPNILFSSEVNDASQLLMLRDPRSRVAKVAPWLTLDGDVYPAVVNGQIKWIVDGYTSSANYPDSQLINLRAATRTTLTANGASIAQASTPVNYLQNSVKAVVDAYTGEVTLYAWNQQQQPDPLLSTWESVFPGLVKPQSSIPAALQSQLRYPTDLFNVQRYVLARYHVTQPASFYSGNDFWAVPTDPTVAAAQTINAGAATGPSTAPLPARYGSMAAGGSGAEQYSLSSPMVTLNGRQLAAFVSVDSVPGPDYGKFTVLRFPAGSGGESPAQVQNDIESDTTITEALTLQRGGNSSVVLGDLEAIPVAGRMLYVEPVYTQSSGGASFPILRHVIALYGNGDPSFDASLTPALNDAIRSGAGPG